MRIAMTPAKLASRITAALLIVLTPSLARGQGSRWMIVAAYDNFAVFVDTSGMVRQPTGTYFAWIKTVYSHPKPSLKTGAVVAHSIAHDEVNCDTRQFRSGAGATYNAAGTTIETFDSQFTEWQDPFPESLGEDIVVGVCDKVRPTWRR